MNYTSLLSSKLKDLLHWLVVVVWFCSTPAWATKIEPLMGNDEEAFVFAGICPNGEPYRLYAYSKHVKGLSRPHFDYDGPVGIGTVQSNTAPKVMAARICRKQAEIISTHYWE